MRAEVGQVWASTRPDDQQKGHNQRRRVLAVGTKTRWVRASDGDQWEGHKPVQARMGHKPVQVPAATLTCDGNGGKMQVKVMLKPDGSIPNHALVSEPDPRLRALADTLRGIETRPPFSRYTHMAKSHDLADEVYEAFLWPRLANGEQNPRIEVVLHQDALLAITQRINTLVQALEQVALDAIPSEAA